MIDYEEEVVYGQQMPRLWTMPDRHIEPVEGCKLCAIDGEGCGDQIAKDVIDWCNTIARLDGLDPWQEWFLYNSLGTTPRGKWAAKENALIVSRQNGKGSILEARELAGLFVLDEELIIHTAHEFKTSIEHFRRVVQVIDDNPSLSKRLNGRPKASHGDEAIELKPEPTLIMGSDGKFVKKKASKRLRFLARSKGSGRGFSCDCLVYDEAMILSEEAVGASMPTMSARAKRNFGPQIFYTASSGLEDSFQLGAVRQRIVKNTKDLFGAEWSINKHTDACQRDEINGRDTNYYIVCTQHDDRDDPKSWAKANPAYGYRIDEDFTKMELAGMPADQFDVERLGLGKWPTNEEAWSTISEERWKALTNEDPGFPTQPIAFGADIDEDGKSATICAAWKDHETGKVVLEIPRECARQGTDWVLQRLAELYIKRKPVAIALPKSSPAGALVEDGKKLWRDRFLPIGPGDEAAAFAYFVQQVKEENVSHFGKEKAPTLWHALGKADTRVTGDGGKAWSRRDSESDITPITSATVALWALNKMYRNYDPLRSIG